jgi:hypothetical protein
MRKTFLLWIAAIIITAGSALYQRFTGPSYPVSGEIKAGAYTVPFNLPRTHSSSSDLNLKINTGNTPLEGKVIWKRFKSSDDYSVFFMEKNNGVLETVLPKQPPAGKIEYSVILFDNNDYEYLLTQEPVVIRFKGDVPAAILIPHIFTMFFAMLISTRTGLEIFNRGINLKRLTILSVIFLFLGGIILGPLTQLYAFGALWTGFPFGTDLTDNKTLIALIAWLIALAAVFRFNHPERWTAAAAVVLLIIFMIPHSMLGSELDYQKLEKESSEQIIINK